MVYVFICNGLCFLFLLRNKYLKIKNTLCEFTNYKLYLLFCFHQMINTKILDCNPYHGHYR